MPEKDPDDGEIDDVDEFLHTIGPVERDEAILNILGEGFPLPNLPGPAVDQEIADMLGTWRDNVNSEPIRDTATGQEHPAGGPWPPTNTGGTVSDSIEDKANQLDDLAGQMPMLQTASTSETLTDIANKAAAIIGEGGAGEVWAIVAHAELAMTEVNAAIESLAQKLHELAAYHRRSGA